MLFILEHNTSIMGSLKSIIGKILGIFQKHFGQLFEHIWLRPSLAKCNNVTTCHHLRYRMLWLVTWKQANITLPIDIDTSIDSTMHHLLSIIQASMEVAWMNATHLLPPTYVRMRKLGYLWVSSIILKIIFYELAQINMWPDLRKPDIMTHFW